MALTVNGKVREDIGRADFVALGAACGLRERAVTQLIDRLLAAAPRWIGQLDDLPFDPRRIHKLRKAVGYRIGRLTAASR
jgi:hypothetical protein